MYYPVSKDGQIIRYIPVRGSSKLEGFHRWMNALLSGSNNSKQLAQAMQELFVGRWNINSGISNMGKPDYGTHEHKLLYEVKRLYELLGFSNPFPQLEDLSSVAPEPMGYSFLPMELSSDLITQAINTVGIQVEGEENLARLFDGTHPHLMPPTRTHTSCPPLRHHSC